MAHAANQPPRHGTTLPAREAALFAHLDREVTALRETVVRALGMVQLARKASVNLQAAEYETVKAYFATRRLRRRIRARLGVGVGK